MVAVVVGSLLASGCEMEGRERGPVITWWAQRPHEDRGPCTDCHLKVDGAGNPVPVITSASRMPHMDRGVCSNCHPISRGGAGGPPPVARQVGLTRALPPPPPPMQF